MTSITRKYLNGTVMQLSGLRDDADLPHALAVDVLDVVGTEVEILAGSPSALDAFLAETRATRTKQVTLPNGLTASIGTFGMQGAVGYPFWLTVGSHRLYGHASPGVTLHSLTQCLGRAAMSADANGVTVDAPRSAYRRPCILQSVSDDYLIDIRPARQRMGSSGGHPVEGGLLSRSDPEAPNPYLLLDADRHLAYILPVPGRNINVAVEGASSLVLTEVPGPGDDQSSTPTDDAITSPSAVDETSTGAGLP